MRWHSSPGRYAGRSLSNTDFSIHAGRQVTGWPVMTIRHGEMVYEDAG